MAKSPKNDPPSSPAPSERIRPGEFVERDLWHLDEDGSNASPAPQKDPPRGEDPGEPSTEDVTAEPPAPLASTEEPAVAETPDPEPAAEEPPKQPLEEPGEEKAPVVRPPYFRKRKAPLPRAPLAGFATMDQQTQSALTNRRRAHPFDSTFSDLDSIADTESLNDAQWADEPPAVKTESLTCETPPAPEPTPPATKSAPTDDIGRVESAVLTTRSTTARNARRGLSLAEKLALAGVALVLLSAAIWIVRNFSHQIPTNPSAIEEIHFPIKGQRLTILEAATHWRKPRRDGSSPDAARAETRLLPVIKLKIEGKGQGAIRLFFRNELGDPIGDSITRTFANGQFTANNSPEIEIPATAGFDDEGMYDAYRASRTTPWRVHIHEGPDAMAAFQAFQKILEIPISTNRQ